MIFNVTAKKGRSTVKRLFVETEIFRELVDEEKEKDLERRIKEAILQDPSKGDVISGTGGLRKMRFAKSGKGKSGGYRVIYLDLVHVEVTYLFFIYGKNVQENLTAEQKRILKTKVEEIKNEYKSKGNK